MFKTRDDDSNLKIIDFGLSSKIEKPNSLDSMVGTPYYVAPEVLDENSTYGRA